jgi:RNA polymerase sigma factor (sigma-70 family)
MPTRTGDQTDEDLLERFTRRKEEAAFAELVRRYGPMVLGVCRKMLRHQQDAEDVVQATFLVLARKSGSIRNPAALPNWLYGVTCRLAVRARGTASRRRAREVPLEKSPTPVASSEPDTADLGPALYEEIARLPDRYRAAFVLCYLQGQTNEEAARQLGCAPGTVFSRLARARDRLRSRLKRRGIVLSPALLRVTVSPFREEIDAALPPKLETATVRLAVRSSTGKRNALPVPPRVARLAGPPDAPSHRRYWLALLLVVMLLAVTGATVAVVLLLAPPTLQQQLQGTRDLQTVSVDGRAAVDVTGLGAKLVVRGDRMTMKGGGAETTGVLRIEADSRPVRFTWTVDGTIHRGIFDLRPDGLSMCTNLPRAGRVPEEFPTDFAPAPGKSIQVFRRAQP